MRCSAQRDRFSFGKAVGLNEHGVDNQTVTVVISTVRAASKDARMPEVSRPHASQSGPRCGGRHRRRYFEFARTVTAVPDATE